MHKFNLKAKTMQNFVHSLLRPPRKFATRRDRPKLDNTGLFSVPLAIVLFRTTDFYVGGGCDRPCYY
ncbi:hypothetical protein QUA35_03620 [Microcoleus sp. N9_B2]|uniref:hypothetical protein n=1 Tax=unclassified Microcoleus TaxID=2642155 RepID=UPI002FD5111F